LFFLSVIFPIPEFFSFPGSWLCYPVNFHLFFFSVRSQPGLSGSGPPFLILENLFFFFRAFLTVQVLDNLPFSFSHPRFLAPFTCTKPFSFCPPFSAPGLLMSSLQAGCGGDYLRTRIPVGFPPSFSPRFLAFFPFLFEWCLSLTFFCPRTASQTLASISLLPLSSFIFSLAPLVQRSSYSSLPFFRGVGANANFRPLFCKCCKSLSSLFFSLLFEFFFSPPSQEEEPLTKDRNPKTRGLQPRPSFFPPTPLSPSPDDIVVYIQSFTRFNE